VWRRRKFSRRDFQRRPAAWYVGRSADHRASDRGGDAQRAGERGHSGVTQYIADAVNDPPLEFDAQLNLASRRAILFGDAGRLDDAFDYLDQAIAARDPSLVYLSVAPHWDSLRGDPRFSQRLGRLALPAMT